MISHLEQKAVYPCTLKIREEIKEKMNNTNKIVKPNLKKKNIEANAKSPIANGEVLKAEEIKRANAKSPIANGKSPITDETFERVENLSILEQAKQQNEIDSRQLKELQEQKKKKSKQIIIISCIGVCLVIAIGFVIITLTKKKSTDETPTQGLVEAGIIGINPVTGDQISREQATEYQEKIEDTNKDEAELFYNSSNSTSIDKDQYVSLYSYYRNNGYNTSDTNKLVDKYFKDNKEYKGTDEENSKADKVASDSNIKPDWGNTTGTINSKDTSTSNGADINGSTKTFEPSDELRKYNEEASKANETAE